MFKGREVARRFGPLVAAAGLACGGPPSPGPATAEPEEMGPGDAPALERRLALASLRGFEESRRAATDFATVRPWDERSGADPFDVVEVEGGYAVALRGANALARFDAQGGELGRVPAPARPTDIATGGDGELFVVGEGGSEIAAFKVEPEGFAATQSWTVGGVASLRSSAALSRRRLLLADRHRGELVAVALPDGGGATDPVRRWPCTGVTDIAVAGNRVAVNCLLDHEVRLFELGDDGWPGAEPVAVIKHDGPIWAMQLGEGSLVAAGVEDRPLDRSDGAFGYIDSFVFVYDIAETPVRRHAINVAEHGVITPKALAVQHKNGGLAVTVTGYGSDRIATLSIGADDNVKVTTRAAVPGIRALAGGLAVSPMLDAVVPVATPDQPRMVDHGTDGRSWELRVGEALFFSRLMAPSNSSDGRRSRFTCETCHFEGTVDGRTHWTGRGDVHATTKTLLGLGNNRPYFSRALDRSMTKMVNAEFRVAGKGNPADPWFTVTQAEFPWLQHLGAPSEIGPIDLRRALMEFLFAFVPGPNPAAAGSSFNAAQQRGAELFAEHCEGCHQARLVADEPSSRVPAEQWEALVLSGGGQIVWGTQERVKTGVEPYVHAEGARVVSLRRLYVKHPYLTNGTAKSVQEVLERVGLGPSFSHQATPDQPKLGADEREALAAFVDLL